MPLREYVCMSDHVSERLVPRGSEAGLAPCGVCHGPAVLVAVSNIAFANGRLRSTESLHALHEAALEAEHAGLPDRIWHAAKVRSEAQLNAGAEHWSPEVAWDPERVG